MFGPHLPLNSYYLRPASFVFFPLSLCCMSANNVRGFAALPIPSKSYLTNRRPGQRCLNLHFSITLSVLLTSFFLLLSFRFLLLYTASLYVFMPFSFSAPSLLLFISMSLALCQFLEKEDAYFPTSI